MNLTPVFRCGRGCCRESPECGAVPVEEDELVLTSREDIPPSGGLPEGEVPEGGCVPVGGDVLIITTPEADLVMWWLARAEVRCAEGDELVLTSQEETSPSGGLPEGKVPEGGCVPVGGDILKINQPDGILVQWWVSRAEVLCFAEEVRGSNSEHKCPSKNQSLEEEEERKEE